MMNIKSVKLDTGKSSSAVVFAKQNDCNSRFLNITFMNNGYPFFVPDTATVAFNVRRADGDKRAFFGAVDAENHTITVELNSWILSVAGTVQCDISVVDGDKKLTSATFSIEVEAATVNSEDISEDENYDILTELINSCNNAVASANTAATAATNAATAANTAADVSQTAINAKVDAYFSDDDKRDRLVDVVGSQIINDARESSNRVFSSQFVGMVVGGINERITNAQTDISSLNIKVNDLYGMAEIDKSTPANIQKIVRMGLANVVFKVGEQFTCEHYGWGVLTWDIIAINFDPTGENENPHNLWLQLHSTLDEALPFDAAEPDNPDTNVATYGYNRWSKSNIRQWLNSDQDCVEWWQAQHEFDEAPEYADDYPGFLMELDPDFLEILRPVTVRTALSEADGGGYEETTDRFFLPSQGEVYGGVDGESQFPYYQNLSNKTKRSSSNTNGLWRLRNPNPNNTYQTGSVYYGGSYYGNANASLLLGIAPVCCIY